MTEAQIVFGLVSINVTLLFINVLTVWMNIKLLTENVKHRLLKK